MIASSGSAALLSFLSGEQKEDRVSKMPQAMGPTLVKIADPQADAELVAELLDEATREGRRRNRYLQRSKQTGLELGSDNKLRFNGRRCCGELVEEINASLHVIAIPSEYTCTCGTSYRVQHIPREERRHGF